MQSSLENFDKLPAVAAIRLPVVAALFSISPASVKRRVRDGTLPPPKKIGRLVTWNVGELRRALQKSEACHDR